MVPASPRYLLREVSTPKDFTAGTLSHFFGKLKTPMHLTEQVREALQHGSGEHPRGDFPRAAGNHGQAQHVRTGGPSCELKNPANSVPAEARRNDDAAADSPRIGSTQWNGSDGAAAAKAKADLVRGRDDLGGECERVEGKAIRGDEGVGLQVPGLVSSSNAKVPYTKQRRDALILQPVQNVASRPAVRPEAAFGSQRGNATYSVGFMLQVWSSGPLRANIRGLVPNS